jgi:predicted NAD/FAD-binding protein
MRIAIIGSGISGLGAAYALDTAHDVSVFERDTRIGGHSNTVDVNYDGAAMAVDTGFIVYNELNYPNLTALFADLGVQTDASSMSFGVSRDHGRLEWGGDTFSTLFAQKRNFLDFGFLTMVRDILRFNKNAARDLALGNLGEQTLGTYLARGRYSRRFADDYLLPMSAAIWSSPLDDVLEFPAASFISFFDNHRLLSGFDGRPVWRTVRGGSRTYVKKLTERLRAPVRTGNGVKAIHRSDKQVHLEFDSGARETFDQVILATHGDISAILVSDADAQERAILGAVRYAPNTAYLHRDQALMPKRRAVWSAWNYLAEPASNAARPVTVTYWMNRLQNLDSNRPIFVTLNPIRPPRADLTFAQINYDHPQFDLGTLASQKSLDQIQGRGGLWYCGAWTGHGFHEDGLRSGLHVARLLGADAPWSRRERAA